MKMIVLRLIIIGLWAGFSTIVYGLPNNSSFVGRRVALNFSTSFSPAWNNPNFFENSRQWKKYYAFNYTLIPSLEAVVWRLGMAGAEYCWFNTRFSYTYPVEQSGQIMYYDHTDRLTVHGFGVFYRQYFGEKSRAPMGWHAKLGLNMLFYNAELNILARDPFKEKGRLYVLNVGIGYDYLFFNRLRVGLSADAGFPLYKWVGIIDVGFPFLSARPVHDYVRLRIIGHSIFNLTATLGCLLF
jgi:hypothetical protein